jgi:hypothetical protein
MVKSLWRSTAGSCSPSFELVCFNRFQVGQYPDFQTFGDIVDSYCLILEDTGPICLGKMMDDYGEVFAALKGSGSCSPG